MNNIETEEEIIILAPEQIGSNKEGPEFLSLFFQKSMETNKKIIVNFKNTRWLRANLSSVLGAICWNADLNNNKISFKELSPSIKKILSKNKFLEKFGVPEQVDYYNTTIKYEEFDPNDKISFSEYIRNEFIPSLSVEFSKNLEQNFRNGVEELFQNCRLHGKCDRVFVCGQYFPQEKRLYFTITNIGATIKENIDERFPELNIDPRSAIIWATKKGNTTRIDENIGGIGLDFLINFLDSTKGKIQIISDKALYERINKNQEETRLLKNKFSGTIVTLIFSLNDISKEFEIIDFFKNIEVIKNFF